ncbi:MAG: NADH-quinone oxidoreductase subunit J [Acidobacteriota bacterium]
MLLAAFYLMAIVALAAGLMVVLERNPVVSALDLAVCLVAVGIIYLMLDAYMLAAIQVFVYAGAVVVLFLFVIMLLSLGHEERRPAKLKVQVLVTPILLVMLFAGLYMALYAARPPQYAASLARDVAEGRTRDIGHAFLFTYLYPFELASVLLLVALVSSLVLARRKLS